MTNDSLKQLFSTYSGYVYQFIGSVPDGESPLEYITVQFVSGHGDTQINTSITQLTNGKFLVHSSENIESEKFVQIADFNYQEPLLPDPEPEVNTQTESVKQGDQ
jgi:hypothetical protein